MPCSKLAVPCPHASTRAPTARARAVFAQISPKNILMIGPTGKAVRLTRGPRSGHDRSPPAARPGTAQGTAQAPGTAPGTAPRHGPKARPSHGRARSVRWFRAWSACLVGAAPCTERSGPHPTRTPRDTPHRRTAARRTAARPHAAVPCVRRLRQDRGGAPPSQARAGALHQGAPPGDVGRCREM